MTSKKAKAFLAIYPCHLAKQKGICYNKIAVGNAHSKLLAYRSFPCIQTMQNSEVDSSKFL